MGRKPEFIRGELNEGETAPTPLYQLNPNLFYYWTAMSSVDRGLDAWELKYHAQDSTMKTAISVTNSGSGWQTAVADVTDALLDNGDPIKNADLVLENTGGTNCRFHMIELDKTLKISGLGVSIDNCPLDTLTQGGTCNLNATVSPSGATDKSVSWSSSNTLVATVNASGLVTAVSAGSATITVTTNDGGFTDVCSVSVVADTAAGTIVTLVNRSSGKRIKPVGSNSGDDILVTADETDWTKWIKEDEGEYFYLKNVQTNLYLRPENSDKGAILEQSSTKDDLALWEFVSTDVPYGYITNKNTAFEIKPGGSNEGDAITAANGTGWLVQWELIDSNLKSQKVVSSIENSSVQNLVKVYPNPVTNGLLNVSTSENIDQLQIFDISGKMVLQELNLGTNATMDLSKLNKGLYLIRFLSSKGNENKKIIVE